ncbi:MAG TPA: phosphatase PAP2 family protein [Pirellulaceae bacterium]|nr:phosphatase PAP2 family protein [Pirellulaceae bacterium]
MDIQERRTTLPADPRKIAQYLEASRSEMSAHGLTLADQPLGIVYLLMWNHVALDATAQDHSTLSGAFGEQLGPARTSRATAIVHLAMFEAVNAISRKHPSYRNTQTSILSRLQLPADQLAPETASIERAIIEAGYRTLVALYPEKKAALLDVAYGLDLEMVGDVRDPGRERDPRMILGEAVGAEAANAILSMRMNDGSELPDLSSKDFDSPNPNTWHQDPVSQLPVALGGNWSRVMPFAIDSASSFRPGSPNCPVDTLEEGKLRRVPDFSDPEFLNSPEFIASYKDVKDLGGDPNANISAARWPTPTSRTGSGDPSSPNPADNSNQTFVGIFWGYDGTALLCAPPRLYNMIATSVALRERPITTVEDMSQYLAYINMAMADAGIAAWDAKYHFLVPRPVTYIRAVSVDATPAGSRNPRWTPLGAPVTNGTDAGRNLTPPFPAYPSGHATFGGAIFKAMTLYFKHLDPNFPEAGIPFEFVSDEYNGLNRGPGESLPRQRAVVQFGSFEEAEALNARSRIYIGVHWDFDGDHGVLMGNKVAADVFAKFITPAP